MKTVAAMSATMGENALASDDLDKAEELLMKAYHLYNGLAGHAVEADYRAVLRNLVILQHKKSLYEEALPFLLELLSSDPDEYESVWLAAKTYLFLEDIERAFDLYCACYNVSTREKDGVDSLLEIVNILVSHRGRIEARYPVLNLKAPSYLLKETVRRLSEENRWEAVNILMGLSPASDCVLDGLAKGCGTEDVNVGSLLKTLGQQALSSWGQKLAVGLLKGGASVQTLKDKGDEPMFVSLKLGLKTGLFDFLKYLLQNLEDDMDEKGQVNESGDSLFHLVVKSGEVNTTVGETAIRLLLNHDCRPDIRDKDGKLPVEYLNPSDQVYALLQKAANKPEDLASRLNLLRERGKSCMQSKAYSQALRHYSKGIRLASEQESFRAELSVFYSNRSAVYNKLDKQQEALLDAEACISNNPTWPKGYWRKGQILKTRGRYSEAFITFQRGYESEKQTDDAITCLVDAASVLSKIEYYQPFLEMLETVEKSAMTTVIQHLSKKGDWWALRLLVLGGSDTGKTDRLGRVAQGTTAKGVSLCGLANQIKATEHVTDSWRYDLLCAFLSMGASVSTLVTETGDTPYHAALKLALHMEDTEILETVINTRGSRFEVRTAIDHRGDNLLHTLFKSTKVSCRIVEILAELLMNKGVDPGKRDPRGKLPEEYLPAKSELKALIKKCKSHSSW